MQYCPYRVYLTGGRRLEIITQNSLESPRNTLWVALCLCFKLQFCLLSLQYRVTSLYSNSCVYLVLGLIYDTLHSNLSMCMLASKSSLEGFHLFNFFVYSIALLVMSLILASLFSSSLPLFFSLLLAALILVLSFLISVPHVHYSI